MAAIHPRPLRPEERALLDSAIATLGVEAPRWREQAAAVEVASWCPCDCGTIDFGIPGRERAMGEYKLTILADGTYEVDGDPFGVILFANEGRLWTLEIVSYAGKESPPYPSPDQVKWYAGPFQ